MAGSYNHVTLKKSGKLRNSETILIDNMGDAYETIEEMYGMIWYLAGELANGDKEAAKLAVEQARTHYQIGIAERSPGVQADK